MCMHLVCCLDGAVSHKCIYMHIVFASILRLWIILCLRVFVCMAFHFFPLCAAVLVPAFVPLYLLVLILHTRPSVCQCFTVLFFFYFFPAARLCTCCCAICASSWCLLGIRLFTVLNHRSCMHGLYLHLYILIAVR